MSIWEQEGDNPAGDVMFPAGKIEVEDAGGYYAGDTVEEVLAEIAEKPNTPTPTVSYVSFTPQEAAPAHAAGRTFYDTNVECLSTQMDDPDVTLNHGRELLIRVRNNSGATIANGKVVVLSGAVGQLPTIALADRSLHSAEDVIAVATHDIENNSNGYVTAIGEVRGLNTSAFEDGATVYLASTAGDLTAIAPTPPTKSIKIGKITYSHVTNGILFVSIAPELSGAIRVTSGEVLAAWESVVFKTSTTDVATYLAVAPNGAATAAGMQCKNASGTVNNRVILQATAGYTGIYAEAVGGATLLPLQIHLGGVKRQEFGVGGDGVTFYGAAAVSMTLAATSGTSSINLTAAGPNVCNINLTNGSGTSRVYSNGSYLFQLPTNSLTYAWASYAGGLIPWTDNTVPLGNASQRPSVIYAASGTINTSDENEKTNFREFSEKEIAVAVSLASMKSQIYQWIDSVKRKGEDKARLFAGPTVQQIIKIFEEQGLDAFRYGMVCFDKWERKETTIPATTEEKDGEIIILEPARVEILEAGERYSLRYEQLDQWVRVGLIEINKAIEERLTQLEGKK